MLNPPTPVVPCAQRLRVCCPGVCSSTATQLEEQHCSSTELWSLEERCFLQIERISLRPLGAARGLVRANSALVSSVVPSAPNTGTGLTVPKQPGWQCLQCPCCDSRPTCDLKGEQATSSPIFSPLDSWRARATWQKNVQE